MLPGLVAREVKTLADAWPIIEALQERLTAAMRPRPGEYGLGGGGGSAEPRQVADLRGEILDLKARFQAAERAEQASRSELKQAQTMLAAKDSALRLFGDGFAEQVRHVARGQHDARRIGTFDSCRS